MPRARSFCLLLVRDDQTIGRTRIISNQLGYPGKYGGFECKDFDEAGLPLEWAFISKQENKLPGIGHVMGAFLIANQISDSATMKSGSGPSGMWFSLFPVIVMKTSVINPGVDTHRCVGTVSRKARVSETTRSWNFGSRTSAEPSIG
jgi:hypothetical protein